jgi:heptosyltransferase-1
LSSLGDVVHSLPVLVDIKSRFPDAQIDWVVEPAFASLLQFNTHLDRVIVCSLRDWTRSYFDASARNGFRSFLRELRETPYDVVIDLQGLGKSALISRCASLAPNGIRVAMANQTDGSSYECLTRWVSDLAIQLPKRIHAVERGRLLCSKALAYEVPNQLDFGLSVNLLPGSFQTDPVSGDKALNFHHAPKVLLIHGTSRADKAWPLSHWIDLSKRLIATGYEVCVTYASDAEYAFVNELMTNVNGLTLWHKHSLSELSNLMRNCFGAIGVDSGVSHLAVALDLAHVQIYNFPTDWRTGPLHCPYQTSVYTHPTPNIDLVWREWLNVAERKQRTYD